MPSLPEAIIEAWRARKAGSPIDLKTIMQEQMKEEELPSTLQGWKEWLKTHPVPDKFYQR